LRPSTELRVVLDPGDLARRRICLFVSYSPDYSLKPHVRLHMAALKAHGFDIVYILVIDAFANRRLAVPINFLSGMIARRNAGFDFGAWADAFRVLPTLWSAERVLLVNDSVFGPIGDFGAMVKRLLSQTADIVGLTESPEYQRHFQSFFLMLQHGALRRREARAFWEGLTNLADKLAVVQQYEVKLLQLHYQWGLAGAALFPWQAGPDPAQANPTLSQWRALLARGFPYLKVQLLRDNPAGADLTGWREVVGDPALLAAIDAEIMRGDRPRMDGA
jgi:lipopolysaccharide biosynthesis protein